MSLKITLSIILNKKKILLDILTEKIMDSESGDIFYLFPKSILNGIFRSGDSIYLQSNMYNLENVSLYYLSKGEKYLFTTRRSTYN